MSWTYSVTQHCIVVDRWKWEHPWVLIEPQRLTVWLGRAPGWKSCGHRGDASVSEYRYRMSKYGVTIYEVSGRATDVITRIETQFWDCWIYGAGPRAVKVTVDRRGSMVQEHGWL